MRLRAVSIRVLAGTAMVLVAVSTLSACRTNVGNAATIEGHEVTETQVDHYVTASAKPLSSSDGTSTIAPKPFVVDILIQERLYRKVLEATKAGAPTAAQLTTLRRQYLQGKSAKATVEKLGAKGYSSSFDSKIVDVQVLGALLTQEQQQGVDINAIVRKIKFPVRVNPRYGTWSSTQLRFDAATAAGLPDYLKLQSSSAAQP